MSRFIQLQITFPLQKEAEQMAMLLVKRQWVACAQIVGPIQSFYTWKENFCQTSEWLLLAKTRNEWFDLIVDLVRSTHSYECPQIVALSIENLNEPYRQWMEENLPERKTS